MDRDFEVYTDWMDVKYFVETIIPNNIKMLDFVSNVTVNMSKNKSNNVKSTLVDKINDEYSKTNVTDHIHYSKLLKILENDKDIKLSDLQKTMFTIEYRRNAKIDAVKDIYMIFNEKYIFKISRSSSKNRKSKRGILVAVLYELTNIYEINSSVLAKLLLLNKMEILKDQNTLNKLIENRKVHELGV